MHENELNRAQEKEIRHEVRKEIERYEEIDLHEVKSGIASPDGAISFLLFIFAIIDGYSLSFSPPISSLFSIGAIQTVLSIGAFIAGLINIIRGKARGNVNILATLLLGLFPGLSKMISLLALNEHVSFDGYMFGIVYLVGCVFVFGLAYRRRHKAWYRPVGTFCLAIGLLLNGWGTLFHQYELLRFAGWFYFVFAVFIYYFGLTVMYFYYDQVLPQGHSFRHWKRKYEKRY